MTKNDELQFGMLIQSQQIWIRKKTIIVIVHILNRNKYGLSVLLYNLNIKASSTYAFIL